MLQKKSSENKNLVSYPGLNSLGHRIFCLFKHFINKKTAMCTVLVCSSCYNRIPQTAWLINNMNLFLTALEAGKSQDQGGGRFSIWWGPASWVIDSGLFPITSHSRKGQGSLWDLMLRALVLFEFLITGIQIWIVSERQPLCLYPFVDFSTILPYQLSAAYMWVNIKARQGDMEDFYTDSSYNK